jgi:hypothetical protein
MLTCAAFAQQTTTHTQTFERRVVVAGPGGTENMQYFNAGPATAEFISAEVGMPGKLVTKAPYTADAVTETTQTLADGNRIVRKSSSQLARDGEGRTRRVDKLDGIGVVPAHEFIIIDDPVAKLHWMLDPTSKTANKMTVMTRTESIPATVGQRLEIRRAGPEDVMIERTGPATAGGAVGGMVQFSRVGRAAATTMPLNAESLGKRVIEGVEAEGTKSVMKIAAGEIGNERAIEIVNERWYSPELQMVVYSKRSDPRSGETVYKLTNIQRSEPSPTLFEVPADYTVNENTGNMKMIQKLVTTPKK